MAARKPSAPTQPSTALVGSSVTVSWSPPAANGDPIHSYVIEFEGAAGGWHPESSDCDGADPDVRTASSCTVPQSVFTALDGPFQLGRGVLVAVRVAAISSLGQGDFSPINTVGARIQTLPAAPGGLISGPGTLASRVELVWSPLTTQEEIGGVIGEVSITSYHVEWDAGTPTGPWAELVGLSSAFVGTSYLTTPSNPAEALIPGQTYRFRVRAQNAQGWGAYSGVAGILAAGVPAQMAMVTLSDNAGLASVHILWASPNSNGSPLTAYQIEILTATPGQYFSTSDCNGVAALALSHLYCDVPMSTLIAAPFGLSLGDPIVAVAKASNSIGWS